MITIGICVYDSMHKIACDRLVPDSYDECILLLVRTESFFGTDGAVADMPPNYPFVLPYISSLTEYSRLLVQEKLSGHSHRQGVMESLCVPCCIPS